MFRQVWPCLRSVVLASSVATGAFGPGFAQTQAATAVLQPAEISFSDALAEALASDRGLYEGVQEFYEARYFLPVWTSSETLRSELKAAIENVTVHGLSPDLYPIDVAQSLLDNSTETTDLAAAELLFAKIFVELGHNLNSGLLSPRKLYNANYYRTEQIPAEMLLRRAASASSLTSYLDELAPRTPEYMALQVEKQRLEAIIAAGDFGAEIPTNRLMRPGFTGDRTILVRNRLKALGYGEQGEDRVYDEDLVATVKLFQEDQRLKPDGVLGPATIGALNASASDRLEQVVINLERLRWINRDLGARHIRVNIADFTMAVVDNDIATFRSKVVVGRSIWDQQTPEFTDQMTHMVINPYWHVPKSIARKEYLPMLKEDPLALAKRGLMLLNGRGQVLNTEGADFSGYSETNFPFDIKQPPGGRNALGRVKFMFPNKHNIYLHDTPAKRLFGRETRAYSHGCVRVEKPFELAYHLLALQSDDPEGAFQSHLRTGRERRVNLETPIPIYLTYNTAFLSSDGEIVYRNDVYGRDKAVLKALKSEGVLTPLDG